MNNNTYNLCCNNLSSLWVKGYGVSTIFQLYRGSHIFIVCFIAHSGVLHDSTIRVTTASNMMHVL